MLRVPDPDRAVLILACACAGCSVGAEPYPCGVAPATGVAPAALPEPVVAPCDAQGWCWESPLPFRDSLGPLWHDTQQTIVTSQSGAVLRLRDGVWEALPALPRVQGLDGSPVLEDMFVHGDTIYISGRYDLTGVLWTFDGTDFRVEVMPDSLRGFAIWSNQPGELMVVGAGAQIRSDGRWKDTVPLRSRGQGLWGCGNTYFAAQFQGNFIDEEAVVARFRGSWIRTGTLPDTNTQFSGIAGTSANDLFVGGIVNGASREVAWHFDGTRWVDIDIPDCVGVNDVASLGEGRALFCGTGTDGVPRIWRFENGVWSIDATLGAGDLSVATPEDIVGRDALNLVQFDGSRWFRPFTLPVSSSLPSESFTGLFDDGSGTPIAIAQDGSVYRRVAGTWTAETPPAGAGLSLRAIDGMSASDFHVVGDRGLLWHFAAGTWTELALPPIAGSPSLRGVAVLASNDAVAVGDTGSIIRFDGLGWTLEDRVAGDLVGVWAARSDDIWAVGDRGLLAHFQGTAWDDSNSLPGNPTNITGIWGAASDRIFVVGGQRVWTFDGTTWSQPVTLPTPDSLNAVWGRSATDVYAVGSGGAVFHFDGVMWTDVHAEHDWTFHAVAGNGGEVRAIGDLGTISVRPGQ